MKRFLISCIPSLSAAMVLAAVTSSAQPVPRDPTRLLTGMGPTEIVAIANAGLKLCGDDAKCHTVVWGMLDAFLAEWLQDVTSHRYGYADDK